MMIDKNGLGKCLLLMNRFQAELRIITAVTITVISIRTAKTNKVNHCHACNRKSPIPTELDNVDFDGRSCDLVFVLGFDLIKISVMRCSSIASNTTSPFTKFAVYR